MKSKVKWFSDEKGFGFIEYKGNKDIFVHYSAIRDNGHKTLVKDEIIEFELIKTENGYKAKNVISVNSVKENT